MTAPRYRQPCPFPPTSSAAGPNPSAPASVRATAARRSAAHRAARRPGARRTLGAQRVAGCLARHLMPELFDDRDAEQPVTSLSDDEHASPCAAAGALSPRRRRGACGASATSRRRAPRRLTTARRTIAAPPCGIPSRTSRSGGSSSSPTNTARDSHVGDSWAMPVSAAPSRRSTRNTIASDHTAVRRVRQPTAMNSATYDDRLDRRRHDDRPDAAGRAGDDRGQRRRRGDRDEGDERRRRPTGRARSATSASATST